MNGGDDDGKPEAHGAVMDGVYDALVADGFADLTMQDIADEAGVSKSLLHYHYDTKQDLLVAFLDHLIERGKARAAEHEDEPAPEHLRKFVGGALVDNDDEDWAFATALLELQAQAPYDAAYRDQLARNEAFMRDHVADIVRDGVDAGEFRDVDPDAVARLVLAAVDGARVDRVVVDDDTPEVVHDALLDHVLADLETDEPGAPERRDGPGVEQ
ncbi:TetR/AcrR family transcriptional regulator [Halobacterium jilantaiense]|uniref:Transcriptional regulator, TetR family n=1 Tax=Halobacterium jilantaiense TaxID=355548 RepID=A0A1I0QFG2_9EURY|nr:TetR/AcrR family transcriptional regulator [Halobacterium jilantaiense]SEW25843.1 transcriptional regulator, TetR family [Halobacterium jilantaiense]